MMQKKRILIDCDPGIDDVLALMFALASPELEIAGITTVCGNVPAALGAENALRILKRAGRLDIPVYVGEEKPLRREYVSAQDTHGMDGLGETFMEPVQEIRPREGAVDFLLETLRAEAGQPEGAERAPLSVLALGPMTNLARALEKDPEAFAFVDQVVSMGGSFRSHGNCSPTAEYNYWCDPDAAAFCYQRLGELGKPIHMVGLDVTRKIVLTPNVLEYMKQLDGELGGFIQQIQRLQQLFLHRFGAVHHMDALFQLSGLIPTQLGGVDLIELFREIIEVFFVELFRQRLLHLFLQAVIRTVCCAHFLQQRVIGAIAVQQAQMVLALQQILVVVLRVDIDEVRSELTQESGSDRALIVPDAAFAFRVDLPADDQFIFVDVESLLFQDGTGRRALPQREHAFDEGAVRPFLDIARRSPLSAKQADGIDQQ